MLFDFLEWMFNLGERYASLILTLPILILGYAFVLWTIWTEWRGPKPTGFWGLPNYYRKELLKQFLKQSKFRLILSTALIFGSWTIFPFIYR